jgi:hypothetical protein
MTEEQKQEKERKLKQMLADASNHEQERKQRLAEITEQEKADREADELARAKSAKYGDGRKGDFINSIQREAGERGLADRVGGGRSNLQKDED